jgi:hypothetical protein
VRQTATGYIPKSSAGTGGVGRILKMWKRSAFFATKTTIRINTSPKTQALAICHFAAASGLRFRLRFSRLFRLEFFEGASVGAATGASLSLGGLETDPFLSGKIGVAPGGFSDVTVAKRGRGRWRSGIE